MEIALQIFSLIIVFGTFLPRLRIDSWMVRGWDFPRFQIFCGGLVVTAGMLAFGVTSSLAQIVIFTLLLAALAMLAAWIRPYTKLAAHQVPPAGDHPSALRVMVSNVLMRNHDSDVFLDRVREADPDLFVAIETDEWWKDRIAALADDYPHAVEVPQEDTYGMVVRSRLPLHDSKVERIVRGNIPSIHARLELRDGTLIHLHVVHPKPPFPDEATSSTDRDAELLLVGERVRDHGGPAIVLGDLNDVAWSRTTDLFQKTSRLLDPRIGRGFYSTYHAAHWWMRWPLDHVFVSKHFQVRRLKRLASIGSDHFPMLGDFAFVPPEADRQPAPDRDREEKEYIEDKVDAAGE